MIRISKLFLRGSAAVLGLTIAGLSTSARADPTPECNVSEIGEVTSTECGVDASASPLGYNNVAVGYKAEVTRSSIFDAPHDATVVGANASTLGNFGTALGASSSATADNAVALGQASVANEEFTVSVGRTDFQRRIVHVAEGIDDNDAVTVRQLNNALGNTPNVLDEAKAYTDTRETSIRTDMAAGDAATLGAANDYTDTREAAIRADIVAGDASTLADANTYTDTRETQIRGDMIAADDRIEGLANTALQTADTAIVRVDALGASTAGALGGGSAYNASTGAVSAPSYAIGGQSYNNVGAALGAVDSRLNALGGRIDGMLDLSYSIQKEARRGIAAAVALTAAPFPSAPGRTSYAANTAVYRGEVAFSGSIAHRLDVGSPLAITGGISYGGGRNTAARIGVAGEF